MKAQFFKGKLYKFVIYHGYQACLSNGYRWWEFKQSPLCRSPFAMFYLQRYHC